MLDIDSLKKQKVIVYISEEIVRNKILHILESGGIKNICSIESSDKAKTALDIDDSALLIIDWHLKTTIPILDYIHQNFHFLVRPIALVSTDISPMVLQIISDYSITTVFDISLNREKILNYIINSLDNESIVNKNKEIMNKVILSRKSRDFSNVEEILNSALSKQPNNFRFRMELVANLIDQQRWAQAESVLDDLLSNNRNLPRLFHLKARCALHRKDFMTARDFMDKALILNPSHSNRLIETGHILLQTDEAQKAKNHFAKSYNISQSSTALNGMTTSALMLDEINEGIELIRNVGSEREKASIFNNAGIICTRYKKFSQAIKLYTLAESLITSKPLLARIIFNKSLSYLKKGDRTLGLELLKTSIATDKDFLKAKMILEKLYHRRKGSTHEDSQPELQGRDPNLYDPNSSHAGPIKDSPSASGNSNVDFDLYVEFSDEIDIDADLKDLDIKFQGGQ